jgi:tetratricopeptide (TPR) repeat protein
MRGWDEAIQLQPSCPDCSKNEPPKSVGGWEVALPQTCPECWNNKGIALANQGKYDDAIRCFDVAIQLGSEYPQSWINKGMALYIIGRFDEASQCSENATRLDPSNGNTLYLRSILQERNEQNTTLGSDGAQWQWMTREYVKEQWKAGEWLISRG